MRPATIKMQHSAGGVIFRKQNNKFEVALIAVKKGSVWCLPKGLINKGETPEETAAREVGEETGLRGEIIDKIGMISYWYFIKEENVRYKKSVDYFLMRYKGGSMDEHDFEVDEVSWFPIDEAIRKTAYRGDKNILIKARGMIEAHGGEDSRPK